MSGRDVEELVQAHPGSGLATGPDLRSLYCELPPPPEVSDRLMCLWTQRITGTDGIYRHSVLPDSCVDIVWIGDASPVVAGPATLRVFVDLPAGTSVIGARFRPGWAACSLELPMDELLNQEVPLSDIWGARADRMAEQVLDRRTLAARVQALGAALTRRFAQTRGAEQDAQAAAAWLARHPSGRVQDLARELGLGDRQLQRRLRATVGYGPKTFQRVIRLQRLLMLAASPASPAVRPWGLAELACGAGYADQAHMCREVRELAGETPRHLLASAASTLSMSDLFNTGAADGA